MIPDRNLDLYIGRKSTRNVNHVGNFFLNSYYLHLSKILLMFKLKRKQLQYIRWPGIRAHHQDSSTCLGPASPRHWWWTGEAYRFFRYSLPATGTHIGQGSNSWCSTSPDRPQPLERGQKLFPGKDSSKAQRPGQESHLLRSVAEKLPCLPE